MAQRIQIISDIISTTIKINFFIIKFCISAILVSVTIKHRKKQFQITSLGVINIIVTYFHVLHLYDHALSEYSKFRVLQF